MVAAPVRRSAAGAVLTTVLLLLTTPSPPTSVRTLADAGSATDQTAPLLALLSLVAWSLATWLALVVALLTGRRLPGAAGLVLGALASRLAPATLRRTLELALGLTVAVGVLGATPAAAATAPGPAAPAGPAALEPGPPAPDLDWAAPVAAPTTPAPAPTTPAPAPTTPVVLVAPGDTLWSLAEQDLAARRLSTSDATIARAWPTWWAANREVVGDDPDLLLPGTRLLPPAAPARPLASS